MKAQGLPITTIVLIIIMVVSLVVVALYAFSGFSKGKESTSSFLDIGKHEAQESCANLLKFGGCPSDKPYCYQGKCIESCPPNAPDLNGDKVCGD